MPSLLQDDSLSAHLFSPPSSTGKECAPIELNAVRAVLVRKPCRMCSSGRATYREGKEMSKCTVLYAYRRIWH